MAASKIKIMEDYIQYGAAWTNEMMKMNKRELIGVIRELKTGAKELCIPSGTREEAMNYCEGLVNDYENGLINRSEFMGGLGQYTGRLMHVFWENAKETIKADPSLLEEPIQDTSNVLTYKLGVE